MGAEITFGPTVIGQVEGLSRDPISQRVRRLITSYGRSLDDLQDWAPA